MTSEPVSPRGKRTQARLLEAAKEVFERDGFLGARVSDIAETAGVALGTFYNYFDSKEDIFRDLAESLEVSVLTMHEPGGIVEHDASPIEHIRSGNRHYLEAYRRERKIMRVIEEVSRYDNEVFAVRVRRQDEFADKLQASIARLQREGVADRRIDPRYAAHALGAMVARFADMWFSTNHRFEMNKAVDQLTILWANALGVPSEPPIPRSR